jgi:hypothetical protein
MSEALIKLKESQIQGAKQKPRTTPKPLPAKASTGSQDHKRLTSYLHKDEVKAVQEIQLICLKAGLPSPTFSAAIGAALRGLADLPEADIVAAIQARPDGRK